MNIVNRAMYNNTLVHKQLGSMHSLYYRGNVMIIGGAQSVTYDVIYSKNICVTQAIMMVVIITSVQYYKR